MNYLLDTNVISELVSRKPHADVIRWIDSLIPERVYLTVITIGEIRKRIGRLPNSSRKKSLDAWLNHDLPLRFADRILPIDFEVMLTWGKLTADLERKGRVLSALDSLIAAQCMHGDYTLATRNVHDFQGTGVKLFNPWDR